MKLTILTLIGLFYIPFAFSEIQIVQDRIFIKDDKNFESKLETKKFEPGGKEAHLSETGFIVSSTQSSFENDRFISRWVSLDENVIKENKIKLGSIAPQKGLSYGIISTSKDFEADLKVGENVLIKRYGLKDDNFNGRIIKILLNNNRDIIQVHFLANNAPELIAGTTCEVQVPHIKKLPYKVSLLSLLHIGLEDYIVIKGKDGAYYPKHATVVDQDAETATILVPISRDLPYVARGQSSLSHYLIKSFPTLVSAHDRDYYF